MGDCGIKPVDTAFIVTCNNVPTTYHINREVRNERTNERTHKYANVHTKMARMHASSRASHGTKGQTNEEMNERTDEAERTNHRKKDWNNRTDGFRLINNKKTKLSPWPNHSSNCACSRHKLNGGIKFIS